jgi:hypothetical protein
MKRRELSNPVLVPTGQAHRIFNRYSGPPFTTTLYGSGRIDAFYTDTRHFVCRLLFLTACAGFGIVASSDPLTKLNDAEDLAGADRPPASREICRQRWPAVQQNVKASSRTPTSARIRPARGAEWGS